MFMFLAYSMNINHRAIIEGAVSKLLAVTTSDYSTRARSSSDFEINLTESYLYQMFGTELSYYQFQILLIKVVRNFDLSTSRIERK